MNFYNLKGAGIRRGPRQVLPEHGVCCYAGRRSNNELNIAII